MVLGHAWGDGAARAAVLDALRTGMEPVVVIDAASLTVLTVTPAFERLVGWSVDELTGQVLTDLQVPQRREADHARLLTLTRDGAQPPAGTYDLVTRSGGRVSCDLHATRLTLPDGQAVAAVTVHSRTDGQPSASFAWLMLDSLPTQLAVLDANRRYLYCNPAAIHDPEVRAGIIGRTDREYVHWRGHPQRIALRREEHFTRALEQRGTVHWEEMFPTANGHVNLRRAYSPVFHPDGTLDVMIGYGSDITESLEQTQRVTLLETMVGTSLDALMVVDVRPGRAYLTVEYGNPALYALLRRHGLETGSDLPLTDWPFGPRDVAAIRNLRTALTRRTDSPQEGGMYTLYLPDLRELLDLTASPIRDARGDTTHWAVDLRVVTDRHREQDVQRRLAEANALALQGHPLDVCVPILLGGVETWYPGWQVGVVYAEDSLLKVLGDTPQSLKDTLEGTSADVLRRLWGERDPEQRGIPLGFDDLSDALQGQLDSARIAQLGVASTVELPLYDQSRQLRGVLFATHGQLQPVPRGLDDLLTLRAPALTLLLERDLQRRQLEQLAYTDPLTGLLNRWTFSARLNRELHDIHARGAQLALGLMDLDRFKHVNDGLGHHTGDGLLRDLARRLTTLAQRHGVLAMARMGGDEFAFLLDDPKHIPDVNRDLAQLFDVPFQVSGSPPLLLQASVGWSVAPSTAQDAETLHQQADAAMYRAKRGQRFSQLFEPTAQSPIQALTLETAMRQALARREFLVVYQPQVSSSTGELYGAEALLRWTNPTLGVIPPDQFIPVAELTGLISPIGAWVLETACRDAARWTGDHLTVSVNVSGTQLQEPGFEGHVRVALTRSGLDPRRLVLEVTETAMIENPASARTLLQALRDEGVRISIDDFGTGYSTLHSLRTLPVDELKIDRTFIHDIGESSQGGWESRAIMRATLQLAHALDITVVAEGVEHQAQADALREVGCDLHQGWLIAPGLDIPDFERFVRDWPVRLAAMAAPPGPTRRSTGS